ncbi:MAG: sugar phosphate isomerase/epimerase family protein, partial [Chloroflexota bacterium]
MLIGRSSGQGLAEDYFAESHEFGFNWLELGGNRPSSFPHTITQDRIDRTKRLSAQYGIAYCLHSASFVNTAEIMPRVREAAVQHLIDYVRVAAKLGAEHLVVHCGYHFSLYMDTVYESLLRTFRAAVEEAERLRMPLLIENMNVLPEEAEIRYLGVTVEELRFVFANIDSPYLGLALDIGHCNLLPGGIGPFIEAFGHRIRGAHLHDNDGRVDHHLPLGAGTVDWPVVLANLRKIGYQGSYTIELGRTEDVAASRDYLRDI